MNRNQNRGFTMLECLCAVAILSISMVVLIRSQTRSLDNVRMVGNYERAVFLTENMLHWTFLDLNESENWEDYAMMEDEEGPFSWRVTVEPLEMEKESEITMVMLKVVATTTWQEGRSQQEFQLETAYFWGEEAVE